MMITIIMLATVDDMFPAQAYAAFESEEWVKRCVDSVRYKHRSVGLIREARRSTAVW